MKNSKFYLLCEEYHTLEEEKKGIEKKMAILRDEIKDYLSSYGEDDIKITNNGNIHEIKGYCDGKYKAYTEEVKCSKFMQAIFKEENETLYNKYISKDIKHYFKVEPC